MTTGRFGWAFTEVERAFDQDGEADFANPRATANIEGDRTALALDVYHQISPQIGVGATIPYLLTETRHKFLGTSTDSSGVGDASVYAFWSPFETTEEHDPDPFFSLHNLGFIGGLSFPTGDEGNADRPALHFGQLGSGSIDARFGIAYNGAITEELRAYVSAGVLIDGGEDSFDFRNGNLFDARLGVSWTPCEWFTGHLGTTWLSRDQNTFNGVDLAESGASFGFIEPGFTIRPIPDEGLFFDFGVSIPIYRFTNEGQPVSEEVYSVGVGWTF